MQIITSKDNELIKSIKKLKEKKIKNNDYESNSIFKSSGNDGSGNGKCNELFCKCGNSCRLCEKRGDDRRTDDRQDYLPQ